MILRRGALYVWSWVINLVSLQALGAVLSSFGALWLAVEIATFFLAGSRWPDAIKHSWYWFGIVGLLVAAWMCRPHLAVSYKLNGRDVTIAIVVGDIFAFDGAFIIGSNTTFDSGYRGI
jgi:hypothetical protein